MKEKAIDLICSVAELSSLFERRKSIEGFLDETVKLIAEHMETDLCSIYLLNQETGMLVLRASKGLNPGAIGNVTLAPGEGITGTALKQLRPIIVPKGTDFPNFKYIPGIDEEDFEAFLAVPILHGLRRIGVIVCQHKKINYFNQRDARALTAIAAQMAAMIENAILLMELHKERPIALSQKEKRSLPPIMHGQKVTSGIALGKSYSLGRKGINNILVIDKNATYLGGIEAFQTAVDLTRQQIQLLQDQLKENFADVGSLIFHAHLLMLTDEAFSGEMEQLIRNGQDASEAVVMVVNRYIKIFAASEAPAVQEKAQDLKDLGHRLLLNLQEQDKQNEDYRDSIIISSELFPSELIKFAAQGAAGIIVHKTSLTSHLKILGQSIKIPIVSLDNKDIFAIEEGTSIILDGFQGTVFIEPDTATYDQFIKLADEHSMLDGDMQIEPIIEIAPGEQVALMANIGLLGDLQIARGYGADSIGLYRSEFPFLIRNDFPSEEEQYRIYHRIFSEFNEGPVYMRILDIGGDKQLGFLTDEDPEANPFLGLRAIRFSLKNREILETQIRAMLRAGKDGNLHIMIPFISSVEEVRNVKAVIQVASKDLAKHGIEHNHTPKIGIMVELPSTGFILEELAREVDFMSIGTNDLIQYLLGVDRTNARVADMFDPFHPAVLRFIARVAEVCTAQKIPLSVCGDAAVNRYMLRFLLGTGIRNFSVAPSSLPDMYKWLKEDDFYSGCEKLKNDLLSGGTSEEIKKILN